MIRAHWHRWLAIAVAVALLLWLPVEDVGSTSVLIISVSVCLMGAIWFLKERPPQRAILFRSIAVGFVAGLAVSPVAVLLIAFKAGLHGHGVPDFSFAQVVEILGRTPFWVLSGALLGAATSILMAARDSNHGT